jgi:hypothetical protein
MRARPGLLAALLPALLLVVGCSGDGPDPAARATPSASPTAEGLPDGTAVPELLSGVECAADDEGVWSASGVVTNPTKNAVSYQVSAQVGPAGGTSPAVTLLLDDVAGGAEQPFVLADVPTSSPDGPCHLQLLALPPG